MPLTPDQIYSYARGAGFPPDTAVKMVAIAMRESSGNPLAFNGVAPDASYGLWQINMWGNLGPARRQQYGLSSNDELFDPGTNARVAYGIWGGDDSNLARHWYIDRDTYPAPNSAGTYRQLYEQYLPLGVQAAVRAGEYAIDGGVGPITGININAALIAFVVVGLVWAIGTD